MWESSAICVCVDLFVLNIKSESGKYGVGLQHKYAILILIIARNLDFHKEIVEF